jgi:hypothetical protein
LFDYGGGHRLSPVLLIGKFSLSAIKMHASEQSRASAANRIKIRWLRQESQSACMIVRLRLRKNGCVSAAYRLQAGAESAVESAYQCVVGLGGMQEIAAVFAFARVAAGSF